MDYTDAMNAKISKTLKEANAIDGSTEANRKQAKLQEVAVLQSKLRDEVQARSKTFGQYDQQIGTIKQQQAEVARAVLQGQPPGLMSGVASALIMKGVFKAIEH